MYAGGLRISDILQLKCANYDGEIILAKKQKTNSTVSIKLPKKAIEIIEFYKTESVKNEDFIFPFFYWYELMGRVIKITFSQKKQLLYLKSKIPCIILINRVFVICRVIPPGFEPGTHSLEGCCSIQLSYETNHFGLQK